MNHKRNVSDNSVYLTSVVAGVLCLINLGSSYAFNIIVSLTLIALLSTYMISIGCVLRKKNNQLPAGHSVVPEPPSTHLRSYTLGSPLYLVAFRLRYQ